MDYYKIYMQKEGEGTTLRETIASFGMYCMEIPFTAIGKIKTLTERNWMNEQGKDVYVPKVLLQEAYTMKIKFGCKGDKFTANENIRKFVDYLTGKDGEGVYMKMYCDYTRIGRRHVRLTNISDDATLVRNDEGDILIISVELAVDDPVTDVYPLFTRGEITKLSDE